MKKLIALGLMLVMSFSLAACEKKGESSPEKGVSGQSGVETQPQSSDELKEKAQLFVTKDAVIQYEGYGAVQYTTKESLNKTTKEIEKALKDIGATPVENSEEIINLAKENGMAWAYYGTYNGNVSVTINIVENDGELQVGVSLT